MLLPVAIKHVLDLVFQALCLCGWNYKRDIYFKRNIVGKRKTCICKTDGEMYLMIDYAMLNITIGQLHWSEYILSFKFIFMYGLCVNTLWLST